MSNDFKKWPRLYINAPLHADAHVPLSPDQTHYFKTVMRRKDGDHVRAFNGTDGEWAARLHFTSKRDGAFNVENQLIAQSAAPRRAHLFFAPIKKARMDMLVEKAVELGVSDLHPILTRNGEVRDINTTRLHAQIIEAAEQCERMDIPTLHPMAGLDHIPGLWATLCDDQSPIFAALERAPATPALQNAMTTAQTFAVVIGPEGGFTAEEVTFLQTRPPFAPVSLGDTILRSETACLYALSLWRGHTP